MRFMTVKDAAKKWGISQRLAQRYCEEGRIESVIKFGATWAIPLAAEKPVDPRREDEDFHLRHRFSIPMPLCNTAYEPGKCYETVLNFKDGDSKECALAEYYYFSGQPEKANEIAEKFLASEDLGIQVSARWIYAFSNLALNKISKAKHGLSLCQNLVSSLAEDAPVELKAMAVLAATASSAFLHLPLADNIPPLSDYICFLPPGLKLFALYAQAHAAYLSGERGVCIGIVKIAFSLNREIYPIPSIYLHLAAVMEYMTMRNTEKAREHFLLAWQLSKSDGLFQPIGEHHGLLMGMVEAVIKKDFPEEYRKIISVTNEFSSGWRKIHNGEGERNVTDELTPTEFTVAMLASRGWINKEIAHHLGTSVNTVKQHISVVLLKLGITNRKEIANFMHE